MSTNETAPTKSDNEDETNDLTVPEAHLAQLDAQQLAALCETARDGILEVVPFSIEPEGEE